MASASKATDTNAYPLTSDDFAATIAHATRLSG
jgi:hypothetical protein